MSNSNNQAASVVHDGAGNVIVAGFTDDGTSGLDILLIKYSGANGGLIWQVRFNGSQNGDDYPVALAVDRSGNVVVAGTANQSGAGSADYYIGKYSGVDGALLWERYYDGLADDFPQAVALDRSGDVVVTGYSGWAFDHADDRVYDYYTAKYASANGTLLWEKRFNGSANFADIAKAVALDSRGNVVVTGVSHGRGNIGNYYTAKYAAATGALLWQKSYNGPGNNYDEARAVVVDNEDNVVVTGTSQGSSGTADYYTVKYAAADGALLWGRRYDGLANGQDQANSVVLDGGGNVVVTGFSHGSASGFDFYTAKYASSNGSLIWESRYNGPTKGDDYSQAVALDRSGNVIVTGYSAVRKSGSTASSDFYTAKYAASNGVLLWERSYNGPSDRNDDGRAVVVDDDGNVIVTGRSMGGSGGYEFYTAKYAARDGAVLWESRFTSQMNNIDQASAATVDFRGDVVVTGHSSNGNNKDFLTVKYAGDGSQVWVQRYNGPANRDDVAQAVAVDGFGNVVVTGYSWNGADTDYYTAKYAQSDGAILWERRYNGPEDRSDLANSVVVDGEGNVVVTGTSYGRRNHDYYTAKYAGSDGSLLWEQRYDGPPGQGDQARAVTIDVQANVIVTGHSSNGTNTDYYTAKYAKLDGALLWERRYNGPANRDDQAGAVAVDSRGNVVVTGYSSNGTNNDYYTAKYAAGDGALLWEQRYNGPANGLDQARAVTVDHNDNVVVTGHSQVDYYTVKYGSVDGAVLWGKRYDGPGNRTDIACALAVDDFGDVIVTGYSGGTNLFRNFDYCTVKYAQLDGALLWEKRYNGPANGDDTMGTSQSLALGSNGLIAITGSSEGYLRGANAIDYLTVVYSDNLSSPRITDYTYGADGVFRFSVTNTSSASFSVFVTTNLSLPSSDWTRLGALRPLAGAVYEFKDLVGTNFPRRFFHLRWP